MIGHAPYFKKYVDDDLESAVKNLQENIEKLANSKQDKIFSLNFTTPSPLLTGTLTETELVKVEIDPYTFSPIDILKIPSIMFTKLGINNPLPVRLKLSTSPTMPSGSSDQIAQFTVSNNTALQEVTRTFYINNGTLRGFPFTTASNTDIGGTTVPMSSRGFDVTQKYFLYLSGTLGSSSDSLRIEGLQTTNI